MTAGRDFLLFVLFLVALGIAWFFTGGPSRTISHSGWFLNPVNPSVPSVELPNAPSKSQSSGSGNSSGDSTNSNNDNTQVYRPGYGYAVPPPASPYAAYVHLDSGSAGNVDPKKEYISITVSRELPGTLTISGWKLESPASTVVATIGNAAQIPYLGQVNANSPVSVGQGARVFFVTGLSPNGASFRINECTGYFEQFQDFTPSLPKECPAPLDELSRFPALEANEDCYSYVQGLNSCTLQVNSVPGTLPSSCQDFVLNTLSYNGCITDHKNDPDFYRNSWLIYLGRGQELWRNTHDTIWLLDENNRLVAQTSY